MPARPPQLSEEKTLARVLWLAKMEGSSVVLVAGCSAMISVFGADWLGIVIGLLATGAGIALLHGVKLLKDQQSRGMTWLVRGELALLNLILVYVAIQLGRLTMGGVNAIISEETRSTLASAGFWGPEQAQFAVQTFKLTYGTVAIVTLLCQGGMAYYYHRNRAVIRKALESAKPGLNPMLMACPACRKTVSIAAPMCPHCGHPLQSIPPPLR